MELAKRRLDFRLLVGICITIAVFGISQSIVTWHGNGLSPEFLWPSMVLFVLPGFAIFLLFGFLLRELLGKETQAIGRQYAWVGFCVRLACAALLPLFLYWEGFSSGLQYQGVLIPDAQLKAQAAWQVSRQDASLLMITVQEAFKQSGGLTVLGVFLYRFFFFSMENPMVLTMWMAFFSSCAIIVAFRLGELAFSSPVARWGAFIVAVFPESVLIGITFLPQTILASLLGLWLICCFSWNSQNSSNEQKGRLFSRLPAAMLGGCILLSVGFFFVDYLYLFLMLMLISALWFVGRKTKGGRITWVCICGTFILFIIIRILNSLHVIVPSWDLIGNAKQYFFDMAWQKMGSSVSAASNDLFENIIRILPQPVGFLIIPLYGFLQPFLPAIIGSKLALDSEGLVGVSLSIVRAFSWYLSIPFVVYGLLAAIRLSRSNKIPLLCGVLFLIIACTGALRNLSDQWNNPFFRMIGLIPLSLLISWTMLLLKENGSRWFVRVIVPYSVGVVGLSVWYLLRSYWHISLPSVATLLAITGFCLLIFFAMIVLHLPKESAFLKLQPVEESRTEFNAHSGQKRNG
jgi:hypothetical protein